jgi:hypothetical protein
MPDLNQNFSGAQSYMIPNPVAGQQPLTMYDSLKQIAYTPEIRARADGKASIILPYEDTGFWGLLSQLQSAITGSDYRKVMASEFFWAEYEMYDTLSFAIAKSVTVNNVVTTTISRFSQSNNGLFVKPIAGFQALIKENSQQIVTITNVTENSGGNWSITIQGINGQIINLTARNQYTLVLIPMQQYVLGTTAPIATSGWVYNPPILWKSWVQKYEYGVAIDESEIDNYVYNRKFDIIKGIDSDGQPVEYFYIPAIQKRFTDAIAGNRTLRTLFDQRDVVNSMGFNGVVPTIRNYGMFNMAYDAFLSGSFKALLFAMIKNIRKVNGSNDYLLAHDFNFGLDWSNAMAELVRGMQQSYKYSLFGDGGVGARDFTYFQFMDWSYSNYHFRAYQVDMFDSYRFGNILEYFALLLPLKRFKDTEGNDVPIVTYCNIVGAEPAKEWATWIYDFRQQGGRTLNGYAKDAFGIEFHAPTRCGMITKSTPYN